MAEIRSLRKLKLQPWTIMICKTHMALETAETLLNSSAHSVSQGNTCMPEAITPLMMNHSLFLRMEAQSNLFI